MQQITYIEDFKTWKEEFSFSIDIPVRFSETDMFGHVNNTSAFIYFEEARIEFMKHKGLFTQMKDPDTVPVVADLQCDYHEQLYFNETIKLFVKANSVGKTSMDLHYMALKENGNLCLTGRGRMVNVNPQTGKPQEITGEEKQKLLEKE